MESMVTYGVTKGQHREDEQEGTKHKLWWEYSWKEITVFHTQKMMMIKMAIIACVIKRFFNGIISWFHLSAFVFNETIEKYEQNDEALLRQICHSPKIVHMFPHYLTQPFYHPQISFDASNHFCTCCLLLTIRHPKAANRRYYVRRPRTNLVCPHLMQESSIKNVQ